jgi:hypothetical protein
MRPKAAIFSQTRLMISNKIPLSKEMILPHKPVFVVSPGKEQQAQKRNVDFDEIGFTDRTNFTLVVRSLTNSGQMSHPSNVV